MMTAHAGQVCLTQAKVNARPKAMARARLGVRARTRARARAIETDLLLYGQTGEQLQGVDFEHCYGQFTRLCGLHLHRLQVVSP